MARKKEVFRPKRIKHRNGYEFPKLPKTNYKNGAKFEVKSCIDDMMKNSYFKSYYWILKHKKTDMPAVNRVYSNKPYIFYSRKDAVAEGRDLLTNINDYKPIRICVKI